MEPSRCAIRRLGEQEIPEDLKVLAKKLLVGVGYEVIAFGVNDKRISIKRSIQHRRATSRHGSRSGS